jgi:hypothetical protein
MYLQRPEWTGLGVRPEQVVAIIESINSPNISIPGLGTEPTHAFLVGVQKPNGFFAIFIYLHLLDTNRPCIYAPENSDIALEHYPAAEAEAIQFAESMGFMLDNLNFRALAEDKRADLVARLPVFKDKLEPKAPPAPPATDAPPRASSLGGMNLDDIEEPDFSAPQASAPAADNGGAAPAAANPAGSAAAAANAISLSDEEKGKLARLLSAF